MARTKVTVYVTPDLADALKRFAAVSDRSMSDIIEDAISRRLSDVGHEAEHAAVMAKFDQVLRRLGVIENGVESHFELTAHAARFAMSVAPEIPEAQIIAVNARGAERFRSILSAIASRLASGRSFWRETLSGVHQSAPAQTPTGMAAE
jgi:predicted transcriptional regulator